MLCYDESMAKAAFSSGVVHKIPADMSKVFSSNQKLALMWEDITPLARNEWICWVTSAKLDETRKRRVVVMVDKMKKGMRRPCCWAGCIHR